MKNDDDTFTKKLSKNYGNAGAAGAGAPGAGAAGANATGSGGGGMTNHNSVEEVSLDGSNKLHTYGNTFR